MPRLEEAEVEENLDFKWGVKGGAGRKNKGVQFYKSFTYDGVEYFQYDSVILYREGDTETSIGKLVEIYETPRQEKKVKIVWYFRPIEIRNFLNNYKPEINELFLASGEGRGLYNINPLEAIRQKCTVLCASEDRRNPQVSKEELRKADYVFYRTFDVAKRKIEESFPEEIAGVKVKNFFNRKKDEAIVNNLNVKEDLRECSRKSNSSSRLGLNEAVGNAVKGGNSRITLRPVVRESKKAANNLDKQEYHPSDNTASRHTTSFPRAKILKCFEEKRSEAKGEHFSEQKDHKVAGPSNVKPRIRGVFGNSSPDTSLGLNKEARENPVIKAENFSNRKKDEDLNNFNSNVGKSAWKSGSSRLGLDKSAASIAVKDGTFGIKWNPEVKGKVSINGCFLSDNTTLRPTTSVHHKGGTGPGSCSHGESRAKVRYCGNRTPPSALDVPFKKRKLLQDEIASVHKKSTKTESLSLEVARRPDSLRKSWFKQLPWEERLKRAHEAGTLLTLENLDPSYTSPEVEFLVWQALHENVEAKMLQRSTLSSPHNGKALVIFKSKDAADLAMSELRSRCLMLGNGRPVIGSRTTPMEPGKPTRLNGHLIIDKIKQKRQIEMKRAVSTSHSSQPNTIEYDLAIPWCVLQEQSDVWWNRLYEKQAKEIQYLRSQLKMKFSD